MKKLLSLIAVALLLAGCNQKTYDRSTLSIITPNGAPALAFYNYSTNDNFETNGNPATGIIPQMVSGQKDVVVLPTNAGIQAIRNKNANYQIAATITFGNFYLVSLNNDTNDQLDADDTILLFQKDNVPDKIFHYVYGDSLNSAIHFAGPEDTVATAAAAANAGSFVDSVSGERLVPNYVLLAQPVLKNVLKANASKGYKVYADMQAKYKEKSNGLPLFQASVFVKKTVERETAKDFLESLKKDINAAIKDPSVFTKALQSNTETNTLYGIDPAVAEAVTKDNNGMGLGFEYAKDNKEAVENFLKLFNIEGLDEEIYF